MKTILALLLLSAAACAQNSEEGKVVRYELKPSELKYTYAASYNPVAHLKSGNILETNTVDCFGNAIKKPGDTLSMAPGDNPLTGPFFIDGAEPGDTLAVKILDITVDSNQGIGALAPGFGAINSTNYTPMLNPAIKEKIWFYPIDHATNTATFQALDSKYSVKFPLHPFFGCIGVAPAGGEARSSVVPEAFGGNMDSPEASVGNTVYFPVNVQGAMLFLGDGHAAMGDGEIAGTALEVPLRSRVQVRVIKGQKINWPRFENDEYIMTVGAYRPLDDALRIATTELVGWIHSDYGLSEMDAYELLSKVGELHLNEMVDPNYVIVAKVKKSYLPKNKIAASPVSGIWTTQLHNLPFIRLTIQDDGKKLNGNVIFYFHELQNGIWVNKGGTPIELVHPRVEGQMFLFEVVHAKKHGSVDPADQEIKTFRMLLQGENQAIFKNADENGKDLVLTRVE